MPRKGPPPKAPSLEAKHSPEYVLYTSIDLQKPKERARTPTEGKDISLTASQMEPRAASRLQKGPAANQGTIYSELLVSNCRSQSLPFLDDDKEEGHFNRRSQPQISSHMQREQLSKPGFSNSLETLCNSSVYQLAGTHGNQNTRMSKVNVQERDVTYAEVPFEPVPNHFLVDDTYEQIPDSRPTARAEETSHTNTYETLSDLKPKQILSARPLKVSVEVTYGKLPFQMLNGT